MTAAPARTAGPQGDAARHGGRNCSQESGAPQGYRVRGPRQRRATIGAIAGAALIAALLDGAARAEPGDPTVHAQLLQALPPDSAIAIEPRDDSDENLQLRDLMIARLAERHGRVADDAPLLLRFSTAIVSDRDAAGGRGAGGARGGGGGRKFDRGLIPRGGAANDAAARPGGPVRHRLSATLTRRDGGVVLWQSEVTSVAGDDNARTLPARLAAALVDHIGSSLDTRRPVADAAPAGAAR